MATIEMASGEVVVFTYRQPRIERGISAAGLSPKPRYTDSEPELEQMIIEGAMPVVVVDEISVRDGDPVEFVRDLAEFERDRVGGIVVLVSPGHDKDVLPEMKIAGANRFVRSTELTGALERLVVEARLDRWRARDLAHEAVRF